MVSSVPAVGRVVIYPLDFDVIFLGEVNAGVSELQAGLVAVPINDISSLSASITIISIAMSVAFVGWRQLAAGRLFCVVRAENISVAALPFDFVGLSGELQNVDFRSDSINGVGGDFSHRSLPVALRAIAQREEAVVDVGGSWLA